jgi:hypothetical protein
MYHFRYDVTREVTDRSFITFSQLRKNNPTLPNWGKEEFTLQVAQASSEEWQYGTLSRISNTDFPALVTGVSKASLGLPEGDVPACVVLYVRSTRSYYMLDGVKRAVLSALSGERTRILRITYDPSALDGSKFSERDEEHKWMSRAPQRKEPSQFNLLMRAVLGDSDFMENGGSFQTSSLITQAERAVKCATARVKMGSPPSSTVKNGSSLSPSSTVKAGSSMSPSTSPSPTVKVDSIATPLRIAPPLRIVLVRGPPGSGKTTLLERIEGTGKAATLDLDTIMDATYAELRGDPLFVEDMKSFRFFMDHPRAMALYDQKLRREIGVRFVRKNVVVCAGISPFYEPSSHQYFLTIDTSVQVKRLYKRNRALLGEETTLKIIEESPTHMVCNDLIYVAKIRTPFPCDSRDSEMDSTCMKMEFVERFPNGKVTDGDSIFNDIMKLAL